MTWRIERLQGPIDPPAPPREVLQRRKGDPGERHALFAALLGAAAPELEVRPALVEDRLLTVVVGGAAEVWLDLSTDASHFGYLPPELRNRPARLVDPDDLGRDSESQRFRAAADSALARENLPAAIPALERFLDGSPRHRTTRGKLAYAYLRLGRAADAGALLRRLALEAPFQPFVHRNLGLALERTGRLEQAGRAYRIHLALEPFDTAALAQLGRLLRSSGDPEGAAAPSWSRRGRSPRSRVWRGPWSPCFRGSRPAMRRPANVRTTDRPDSRTCEPSSGSSNISIPITFEPGASAGVSSCGCT